LQEKESLPWIIRRALLTWLQLTSGCFQTQERAERRRFSDVEDIKSSVICEKIVDIRSWEHCKEPVGDYFEKF
jgi:hypothetical protein